MYTQLKSFVYTNTMNKKTYCSVCGIECSKKLNIEARKGTYYSLCTYCFNKTRNLNMKQIRKLIFNKFLTI